MKSIFLIRIDIQLHVPTLVPNFHCVRGRAKCALHSAKTISGKLLGKNKKLNSSWTEDAIVSIASKIGKITAKRSRPQLHSVFTSVNSSLSSLYEEKSLVHGTSYIRKV